GLRIEMRRRDIARGRRARLAEEGLAADLAHDAARLPGAAEDAGADDVPVERKPESVELGVGALEQALRLLIERLARLAFEAEIAEALALPVEYTLAHYACSGNENVSLPLMGEGGEVHCCTRRRSMMAQRNGDSRLRRCVPHRPLPRLRGEGQ